MAPYPFWCNAKDGALIDLKSPEAFRVVLFFVLPGLVAVFFRAQFLAGRMQKHSDAILTYLAVSIVYWSVLVIVGVSPSTVTGSSFWYFVATILGPALFGSALGLNARFDILRGLLRKAKLNPVHATTTAWDWKLSRTAPRFVIVSMTNGERFGGLYSSASFASSEPSERDIYLEKVYHIPEQGEWQELPGREVLIRPSEIRYIEFLPISNGAENDRDQT